MKFSKIFVFVFSLFLVSLLPFKAHSQGQKPINYERGWKQVDSLSDKQYYSQAFDKAQKLYDQALKSKNSWQSLLGAHYLSIIGAKFKEDNSDSSLARYQRLLPNLDGNEKALCHMLLAAFYADYYSSNRWRIRDNKATDEADLDYKLWDHDRFRTEVDNHLRTAFSNRASLKGVKAESLGNFVFLEESGSDGDLTPTLFDMMVSKTNVVYKNLQYRKLNDRNFDNIDDIVSTTNRFVAIKLKNVDSTQEMAAFVLSLNQEREKMHQKLNSSDRVMIKLYNDRCYQVVNYVSTGDFAAMRMHEMPGVIAEFRRGNDESITLLYNKLAELYYNSGKEKEAMALLDTALALHPDCRGAVECYNNKYRYLRPSISMKVPSVIPSDRYGLGTVSVTNVDTLFFRIVDFVENKTYNQADYRRKLLASPVRQQWSLAVGDRRDYKTRKLNFAYPPMAQGKYLLLASNNRAFDTVIDAVPIHIEDVAVVRTDADQMAGFVVDRKDGKPVKHLAVKLKVKKNSSDKYKILATTVTDNDGHFDFAKYAKTVKEYYYIYYTINYKGLGIDVDFRNNGYYVSGDNNNIQLFFDRPVYKPGDTLHFSLLNYVKSRYDGHVKEGLKDRFIIQDINSKGVDTIQFSTDEFGTAEGMYAIPADAMPGYWHVRISGGHNWSFKVEAYKQPKFTVSLSKPAELRSFGKPAHVEGIAASYSAVPISSATVTYRVVRSEKTPYWRWGWWNWWRATESQVVATGELKSDDKGCFNIEFIPQPDSVSDLRRKPAFVYNVYVKVSDINGETHEASTALSVGYENSYLDLTVYRDTVYVSRHNLDGNELDGKVTLVVEKLRTPDKALLQSDMFDENGGIEMPYSRAEFERMFPYLDYMDSLSDHRIWPFEKKVYEGTGNVSADKPFSFSLVGRPAGVYKLTAKMITDEGDTLESGNCYLYEPNDGKMPVESDLFIAKLENSTCYVGDTVHLRVGSRHDDVTLYMLVRKKDICYRHELQKVSKGFTDIYIPVTDSLLGGFNIELAAMKENYFDYTTKSVYVPFRHKMLDVTLETFRDKLTPGTPERWTLRIKEKYTGLPAKANLLMTMYDAALDKYGSLSWHMNPWSQSYTYGAFYGINSNVNSWYAFRLSQNYKPSLGSYRFHILDLKSGIYPSYARYLGAGSNSRILRKGGAAKSRRDIDYGHEEVYELAVVENDAEMPVAQEELAVLESAADMDYSEKGEVEVLNEDIDEKQESEKESLHIRQNLSTLAFFRPTLRSDDNGVVELSFTTPDLLTKWNIKGQAWTKDLKVGTLSETAITQKPLMVVPNVPRFLRHGDTCLFSVKVSNMDDKEQNIAVTLRMTNATNGQVLPIVVGDTVRNISLKAGTSGEVKFTLAVPRAPIFVTNYMVVARGQGCSDGEQAPIPLLPSRQLVTESMAFYINGAGEKLYEMKHLTELDTTAKDFTLSTLGLTVDLTPNPIWMAMQSLPYVQQRQNPSNIYLANAIYTNSLSYAIVKNNPSIEKIFREWEKEGYDAFISELDRNPDLKQTVMDETPWLRDAMGEEQRHRDVARFFNKTVIEHQLKKDINRLLDAQRSDGGWSWIDGGSYSSLYTTQYILKTLGLLQKQGVELDSRTRRALDDAMDFVDRENYTYYIKYIKNKGYDVVNLDYLYVRSYYPDNKLSKKQKEAYDFFYNNAKKYNEGYRSLFSQSMLSVVFNRHGDKKLAQEMAKRIKEKALYSDEMGMYWRDNVSGWSWSERPIETQAMLIRTMDEVLGDRESVARMQQWILKQKQTTNWNTDVSTVNAIQALLSGGEKTDISSPVRIEPSKMTITYGNHQLATDTTRHQLHVSQRLQKGEVTPADGKLTIRKEDNGIAWGAMYWQYFEQVDKIPSSSMGVTLKRTLYRIGRDGKLSKIAGREGLKVGDKVRIRIEISADRNLEYLELKDPRCAAMEPVSTASGWHWNGGLSYYLAVTNAAQTLYIDRLNKGKYVVEYDMYVNNAGTYVTAPTTIQCLYAPEFRALTPAETLKVKR